MVSSLLICSSLLPAQIAIVIAFFPIPFELLLAPSDTFCLVLILLLVLRLCLLGSYFRLLKFSTFFSSLCNSFQNHRLLLWLWGVSVFSSCIPWVFFFFLLGLLLICFFSFFNYLLLLEWDFHETLCCPIYEVAIWGFALFVLSQNFLFNYETWFKVYIVIAPMSNSIHLVQVCGMEVAFLSKYIVCFSDALN